jgi:hypothetical protein
VARARRIGPGIVSAADARHRSCFAGPWRARRTGPYATGGPVAGPCPDSLIARAKTLAPRVYAAAESTPALLHAELDLGVVAEK